MTKHYDKAKILLDKSEKILIISHRKPDPDTLGAALALKIWLERVGKSVTCACVDQPSKDFSFLAKLDCFVREFDIEDYDLMVIVDNGASYMSNFHLKYDNFYTSGIPIINIDHHASNDNFGDVNIVDVSAASVTLMLAKIFKYWGVELDVDMATCLLAGIYTDTGSFMHSNTSEEVFEISGELMSQGARIAEISKAMFNTKSVDTLRLWGKVLEKVNVTEDKVVMSVLRDGDYDELGVGPENLSGVIDYLNMIPDTKFAVLINEDRQGNVKGSFRTRNEGVDLSKIAASFGGGGHPKASGFSLPGKLKAGKHFEIVSDDDSKKPLEF